MKSRSRRGLRKRSPRRPRPRQLPLNSGRAAHADCGDGPPRGYVWENVDGANDEWKEHTVFDANLGGHEPVAADFTGNGLPDIVTKPWRAEERNALGGKMFVVFLENISGSNG